MADRYSPQLFRVPKSFWMALDFSIPSADLTESSCFSSRLSLHVWGIICTQSMQTKRGSYEEPVLLKEREIKAPLPWEGWWSLFDYLFKNINSNTCRWSINQNNIKSAHWNILILLTPPWPGFHPLQIETYIFIPPHSTIYTKGSIPFKFNNVLWKSFHSSVYRAPSLYVICIVFYYTNRA